MATLATDRHATAHVARFGEPVTLPDGLTVVPGIVSLYGDAIAPPWSEIGLSLRPSQQPNPVLHLRAADAASLIAQQPNTQRPDDNGEIAAPQRLSIRGSRYRIAEIAPDDSGLVRLALTPDMPNPEADPDARWK